MRQIWSSHLVSACSFSTLRLNLVLTHGIAPDVHGGVHIFSHTHYDTKYVQIQNISTTTAVLLYGHVLCLYKIFFKTRE